MTTVKTAVEMMGGAVAADILDPDMPEHPGVVVRAEPSENGNGTVTRVIFVMDGGAYDLYTDGHSYVDFDVRGDWERKGFVAALRFAADRIEAAKNVTV